MTAITAGAIQDFNQANPEEASSKNRARAASKHALFQGERVSWELEFLKEIRRTTKQDVLYNFLKLFSRELRCSEKSR